MIRDIIWDFDGTLFDTYPEIVASFIKALKDNGIEECYENIIGYFMISESYAVKHFKELYGLDDTLEEKFIYYKKNIKPEDVMLFPFAEEVCREFAALGGRNYIITHRGDSTMKYLEKYGMQGYFTEVVTRENAFKRKPDPEAFVYLIEKYSIDKDKAMVIGDRECEILGGKAAGIKTCLYNTSNISLDAAPDYCIDSLKSLLDIVR